MGHFERLGRVIIPEGNSLHALWITGWLAFRLVSSSTQDDILVAQRVRDEPDNAPFAFANLFAVHRARTFSRELPLVGFTRYILI